MSKHLVRVVILVAVVVSVLVVEPRVARADGRLSALQGFAVVVTTGDGAVVRGWLIRVGPKRILIGRYNNTFVRVLRRNVARVTRDPQRTPARYMRETEAASATSSSKTVKGKLTVTDFAARQRLRKAKRVRNVQTGPHHAVIVRHQKNVPR